MAGTVSGLHRAAARAGLMRRWRDVHGVTHEVSDTTLRALLAALGDDKANSPPALLTAWADESISLPCGAGPCRLHMEDGNIIEMVAADSPDGGVIVPGIAAPGYHRLETHGGMLALAVAPRRAFSLAEAGDGAKLWGLAIQLYGLRRPHDGGIGDFTALEEFGRLAARQGAAALALSPAHALFTGDVTRYAPYSPSSRVALNVLHIARDGADEPGALIDWPAMAARKLALLREDFARFTDWPALHAFRLSAGNGLECHAVYEALATHLGPEGTPLCDWRKWPEDYHHPETAAVRQFGEDHAEAIAFHAWLQWRAAEGLKQAHGAMLAEGARIGLVADLAVGTNHAGSHCWSRQAEVLNGVEIGAPPDEFNRDGQGWGITAFSPAGLRRGGYAGFLEMLRHALRYAGGVRIDHIMGLMRLWVIPLGKSPADGAYLTMPFMDLLRLLILESHRHQAVVIGEDLGTVPAGFSARLAGAGISGLRVMWFERTMRGFRPPRRWTPAASAMTSTHDLPTVAGWWRGCDIEWRAQRGRPGETGEQRAVDRAALWDAFRKSGATATAQPADDDGAAVATAAAAHLGRAACQLALLPVEDVLATTQAPNIPGSGTEHPNWRRRLPGTVTEIFSRADVQARLAAMDEGRKAK